MANPACQFEDGKTAVFIGTNLKNGDTVTTCLEHMVEFFTNTLEGLVAAANPEGEEHFSDLIGILASPEKEPELEPEFQAWLDAHTLGIQELVEGGETFEKAVEILLELETEPERIDLSDSIDAD
jgi:hypothetical protein